MDLQIYLKKYFPKEYNLQDGMKIPLIYYIIVFKHYVK